MVGGMQGERVRRQKKRTCTGFRVCNRHESESDRESNRERRVGTRKEASRSRREEHACVSEREREREWGVREGASERW